ncbi:MAG: cmo1, partial [Firmicutes bacterium]|nr:cmo1 [Bacillota bacterium]
MKKTLEDQGIRNVAEGERVRIAKDGCLKLPISLEADQEVLFIQTEGGYRLIPLLPDVKRVYIEVTTKCNFSCITCIRSSWQDDLAHMEW